MTKPLLYDMKRTLTSKSVLIAMGALILISFAINPNFIVGVGPQPTNYASTQVFSYYDASGYHFLTFAWNQFGQGVSGVTFQANLSLPSSPQSYAASASTNSSGEGRFTISAPINSNYTLALSIIQPNGFSEPLDFSRLFSHSTGKGVETIPAGEVIVVSHSISGSTIMPVIDSTNASRMDIQAIWVASYGAPPVNYALYYRLVNVSSSGCNGNAGAFQTCSQVVPPNTSSLNETNMQLLGTMSSYRQLFSLPKLEGHLSSNNLQIVLGLFFPNGTSTSQFNYFNLNELYLPPPPPSHEAKGATLSFDSLKQYSEALSR